MKTRLVALPPLVMLALMTGFFFAFSVCVMPGLDQVAPGSAIEAMQGINEAVRNPVFFVTFFLTPAIALVAAIALWIGGNRRVAVGMSVAALVYLVGVIVVTASINVPMNNALALINPAGSEAASIWLDYSERWTFWNTARTFSNFLAFAIAAIAPAMTLR